MNRSVKHLRSVGALKTILVGGFLAASAGATLAEGHEADGFKVSIWSGYSHLQLPSARLGTIVSLGTGFPTVARIDNAETEFDGYTLGAGVYTPPMTIAGFETVLGLKGYFSDYSSQSLTATCVGVGNIFCEMMPIFDPNVTTYDLVTNWARCCSTAPPASFP